MYWPCAAEHNKEQSKEQPAHGAEPATMKRAFLAFYQPQLFSVRGAPHLSRAVIAGQKTKG